jgi:serine/threonine-protein kinase RsbW
MTEEKFEIHVPSTLGSEKVAMEKTAEIAREMGFSEDRIQDLKTAVAEACLNAIEHGHQGDEDVTVGVTLKIDESRLEVAVQDKGRGPGDIPKPDIKSKVEGLDDTRGWGVFLIEQLMDEVKFETTPEGDNVVRMIIHLEKVSD